MAFNSGKNQRACLEANGMPWGIKYNVPKPGYLEYTYPNEQPAKIPWTHPNLLYGCDDIYYYEFQEDSYFDLFAKLSFRRSPSDPWETVILFLARQNWEWIEPYSIRLYSYINVDADREGFPSVSGVARGGYFILKFRFKDRWQSPTYEFQRRFGYTGIYQEGTANYIGLLRENSPDVPVLVPRKKFWIKQNGIETFSRIDSVCPQVRLTSCYLDPQAEKGIVLSPSQYKIFGENNTVLVVSHEDGETKTARADLAPYPDTGQRKTILALQSPPGCNIYPKISYHCEPCQKCPPGTVAKCCNRKTGKICCYDKQGKCIGEVESGCEKCDC